MPRGGRRHRKSNAEHRATGTYRADRHGGGDVLKPKAARPPSPPANLSQVEREAWREVARQVASAGTYASSHYSAFRLAVKALAAVYAAPPTLKAATLRGLLETASRLLARFGLDPIAIAQVDAPEPRDQAKGRTEAFLFGFGQGRRPKVIEGGGKP